MKVRALKKFETIRDLERTKKEGKDIFPKEGDIWEVSEERAKFLLGHGVIEILEDKKEVKKIENVDETIERIEESVKETVKLNELGNPVGTRTLEEKPKTTKKKKTTKK